PAWLSHIRSVRDILAQMPITPGPALVVFNKIDQVDSETLALAQEEFPLAVFISASQRLGLDTVRLRLSQLIQYAVDGG
ncbi:MAG: GTPase HflX, partial [Sphaerospermopsis kisseleviana]